MDGDFRVGPWLVQPNLNTVSRNGTAIRLEPKVMEVLVCLAGHAGEPLPKETLLRAVWPDTFVSEAVLSRCISELRRVFEDDARQSRIIETIPKRGYRLVAPVERVDGPATEAGISAAHSPNSSSRKSPMVFLAAASGSLTLIFGLLIAFNVGSVRNRLLGHSSPPVIHSLAVIPLKNLSDDPAQKYFSYGMTEQLTTELAQTSGVKVISQTSTIQYENSSKPLPQIARELGVDGVVEGVVQRSGNQVRITVQLIYAPEDRHLWAESYDRDFRDVLELQSNVAAAIVAQIRAQTGSTESIQPATSVSPNLQALEAYLQGNYSLERMGSGFGYDGYRTAITFFKQAISEDPTFAPAYEKLAKTYDAQFGWRPIEIMPLEKAVLRKALELDPGSADAHVLNGSIKAVYDCDFPGAEKEFKEAIRLNPNLPSAHEKFSGYLSELGRHEESLAEAHRAQELDPEGFHESAALIDDGQYDRAIEQLRKHLEFQPNDGFAYIDSGLIDAYAFKGMQRQSVEALEQAWTLFGFKAIGQGVSRAYAASGYEEAFRYSAKQLERLYMDGKVYEPYWIASYYARSGDKEHALRWLQIAYTDFNGCMTGLESDPHFAFLRSDSRFQELAKRAELRQ
jgi:TolB-like protein/DNA-binding winged helix-turn-helix (wHTH) protein